MDDNNRHYSKEPMAKEHAKKQLTALNISYSKKGGADEERQMSAPPPSPQEGAPESSAPTPEQVREALNQRSPHGNRTPSVTSDDEPQETLEQRISREISAILKKRLATPVACRPKSKDSKKPPPTPPSSGAMRVGKGKFTEKFNTALGDLLEAVGPLDSELKEEIEEVRLAVKRELEKTGKTFSLTTGINSAVSDAKERIIANALDYIYSRILAYKKQENRTQGRRRALNRRMAEENETLTEGNQPPRHRVDQTEESRVAFPPTTIRKRTGGNRGDELMRKWLKQVWDKVTDLSVFKHPARGETRASLIEKVKIYLNTMLNFHTAHDAHSVNITANLLVRLLQELRYEDLDMTLEQLIAEIGL